MGSVVRVVDFSRREYDLDAFYLDGSVFKTIKSTPVEDVILGVDLDLDEATEYASDYGKGVRVFTGTRKYTRRQRKVSGTGWPKN